MSLKTIALVEAGFLALLLYLDLVPGGNGPIPDAGAGRNAGPGETLPPPLAGTGASPGAGGQGEAKAPPPPARRRRPLTREGTGEVFLFGKVTDEEDHPLDDCRISSSMETPDKFMTYNSTRSWNGEYGLLLPHPGTWKVHCSRRDVGETHPVVTIPEGCHRRRLDLRIDRSLLLEVEFQDREGRPLEVAGHQFLDQEGRLLEKLVRGCLIRSPFVVRNKVRKGFLYAIATRETPSSPLPCRMDRNDRQYGCGRWIPPPEWGQNGYIHNPHHKGRIFLFDPPPVQVSAVLRKVVLATQLVTPGQEKVVFRVDSDQLLAQGATIKAKLIDGVTGKGLRKGYVNFSCFDNVLGGPLRLTDGVYRSGILPPGHIKVEFYRWTDSVKQTWEKQLDLSPGEQLDLGEVRLLPTLTITGTVRDSGGKPIDAKVYWLCLDRYVPGLPALRGARSGHVSVKKGSFKIHRIGPGTHLLQAIHRSPDRKQAEVGQAIVEVGHTPVKNVTLRTRPAGRIILRHHATRPGGCTFTIHDQRKIPLWAGIIHQGERSPAWIPPGTYTVTVHRNRKPIAEKPITLTRETLELTWPW